MNTPLQVYVSQFRSMNCNKNKGKIAPHKGIMLLAVMECIANGSITNGFVPHNEMMVRNFERLWGQYVGHSLYFNPMFATPFFHLGSEPFWKLMKSDEYELHKEYSFVALRKCFYGAKIEDDLWEYMMNVTSRKLLVRAILEKFGFDSVHDNSQSMADESYDKGDNSHEVTDILFRYMPCA